MLGAIMLSSHTKCGQTELPSRLGCFTRSARVGVDVLILRHGSRSGSAIARQPATMFHPAKPQKHRAGIPTLSMRGRHQVLWRPKTVPSWQSSLDANQSKLRVPGCVKWKGPESVIDVFECFAP